MKHSLIIFFLLSALLSVAQQEEKKRNYQLEFSAGGFVYITKSYHLGIGVNFPGKKPNWYTNFALDLDRYGSFTHHYNDYYTLTIGKHYQWNKNHFYGCLGFNAGLYVAYPSFDENYYRWFATGLGIFPRGEIGWSGKKFTLCAGLYFSLGGGYYQNPELEVLFGHQNKHWFHRFQGAASPYVKIILK